MSYQFEACRGPGASHLVLTSAIVHTGGGGVSTLVTLFIALMYLSFTYLRVPKVPVRYDYTYQERRKPKLHTLEETPWCLV